MHDEFLIVLALGAVWLIAVAAYLVQVL